MTNWNFIDFNECNVSLTNSGFGLKDIFVWKIKAGHIVKYLLDYTVSRGSKITENIILKHSCQISMIFEDHSF